MSSLDDLIAADAKAIADLDGTQVTYLPDGGAPAAIKCFPRAGELEPMDTSRGRTLAHRVVIAVAVLDVPAPKRNADQVTVPGAWVEQPDPVTLRVSNVMMDRTDPGFWLLGLT
jgi:hypothetical protein